MGAEEVERLGLHEDTLLARVRFFEAYADDLQREDESWLRRAEQATALRMAGSTALLLDAERGRSLLAAAGQLYVELGSPFGLFLKAAFDPGFQGNGPDSRLFSLFETLASLPPVQWSYLYLAVVARPAPARVQSLAGQFRESVHRSAHAPAGGLGVPLWRVWRIATWVDHGDVPQGALEEDFHSLAAAADEALVSARQDRHHWTRGTSPVDLVDPDLVALASIVTIVARRRQEPIDIGAWGGNLHFGRIPLQIGATVGRWIGPPEPPSRREGLQ